MSFSTCPRHARTNVSWKLSRTASVSRRALAGMDQPEVVDPDPVGALGRDRVGPLVGHLHAHVLEQRQHVGEHQRAPRPEQLGAQRARPRLERPVERDAEPVALRQLLDVHDVRERRARHPVRPVGRGEGVAVALEQVAAARLAQLVEQRLAQVVRPRPRRGHEQSLHLARVEVGHLAPRDVGHEVQPHEHRLRDAGRVVDAPGARVAAEDRLDAAPVLGVEPVARHVDEQREEAPVRVAAGEQPQPLALAEVQDAHRRLEQLVVRDLEELVARVGVEDLEEPLLVVAPGRERRALEHRGDAPAQHRDLGGARAVGGVGVEAEEAALADADVVEVRGPVNGRARVRLREREPVRIAVESLRRVLALRVAQDAEPGAAGVAIAQEREVVVREPVEEGRGLGVVRRACRLQRLLAHRLPVLDRGAHLADHAFEMPFQLAQPSRVRLARHLGVDDGLRDRALLELLARRVGQDLHERALLVAPHGEHGVHDQVDPAAAPVQLHAHRVDEERHVVGHDLDGGVGGLPAVVLEAGVVDAHLRRARGALAREVEVAERDAVEVERVALLDVLGRDPAVQLPGERLGQLGISPFS